MSKLKGHLSCLVDPATPEEAKLKAAQEVSENLENIVNSQHYSSFLETAIPIFLQLLKEGESQFLADSTAQQVRKLVLDLIHRLPTNDQLKGHVKLLLSAMFSLLEIENEENVLVCLKVIIELHKQFRPSYSPEINKFMVFVKNIYTELPKTMTNALEPLEGEPQIGDSSETTKNPAVLPKASSSLKVLAELPIIVVLMYQLYKQTVHQWVAELIPLSIKTIILQPSDRARQSVNFNKEIYVDFVAVQIKFLSFLAYIIRVYQDQVNAYAHNVVQGMLALLKNCPQEVAHLRRELLIAARHILATDLRNRFVSCIDQLFDEDLLIGCGWTTRETVRSLAYSILADLVHHIRASLTIGQLSQAVHLFSKNVHDDTLPVSIQTMSCKLLLNLVECIRQKGETDPSARDVLMRMMEVFILKFQSIAEYQIPEIIERCQSPNELAVMQDMSPNGSQPPGIGGAAGAEKEGARKMSLGSSNIASFSFSSIFSSGSGITGSAASTYISVADCRGMVKTLVCGMKTITWGAKLPTPSSDFAASQKLFFPRETEVFVKLLKYGLIALDIYRVTVLSTGAHSLRNSNCQTVKTKEEKEVLEYFAGVYTMLSTSMFQEVFTDMVEYVVERVQSNYALQIIPNSFLANASTSAAFAGILLNFLLKHMDELGTTSDLSNLYLKMFKLVFGSVTLFAQENELMLKPHLHEIVNNSMQMAHIAREPCNYFLLLRALFRSIGGGSHELLYQEFLPLLSNLLQGLNRLQSAHHKQYMKDLFVELCLTVPVRLSSLLPYLHLLMDPLVSALNGSQTLVSQGLRTLELCVDNLQPDFLYEHIQPVRAQLMQALWQTLHNSDDSIAQVAFRVLGKFGGSNRKMLTSPQKLEYRETLIEGPCVSINFPDTESPVDLPVAKAIEIAVKMVKPSHSVEPYYRQQAWQLLQAYLVSALNLSDADSDLYQLLKQVHFQPSEFSASRLKHISLPQCSNKVARTTFETALHGIFIASCLRELRNDAVVFLAGVVRLVTAIAVVQQCSSTNFLKQLSNDTMDVYVLLDAIAKCVSAEEKELCRIAELALTFMVDSACTIVGDRDKSSELPLFEVAADKLCGCCYERAWYTKSGGCWAIGFFMDKMPLKWVINHQLTFLMALLFVLHDLSEEVSSGTVLQAQKLIQQLITICNTPPEENKAAIEPFQAKAFHSVTRHLTKEVISPNENVRKQTHSCFQLLSEVTGKSLSSIIEPHKELLVDMIPPRKHLLKHQPINTQIALMDGYTFCSDLSPRLFSVNLTIQEHKIFFQELIALCEGEESTLIKLPCYKSVQSLIPLKTSGLAALAACHYLTDMRERIFSVLYKAINSSVVQLQKAGKEAMRKFMADHSQSDIELVHSALRPLLMMLGDFRNLNPSLLTKLTHMVELFPTSFNEKMCESLLGHLRRWVDVLLQTAQTKINRRGEEVTVCLLIMGMFHMLPASTFRLFEHLLAVCIKAEKAVNTELGSPFRDPLLKFALKFPSMTVDYFLCRLSDPTISRVFRHFLKHKDGVPLKEVLESNSQKLLKATFSLQVQSVPGSEEAIMQKKQELQYQGISYCYLLVESNEQWIHDKTVVIDHLRKIWILDSFHTQMSQDSLPLSHWQECVMLLKCLLAYCKSHHEDIILLFQLVRAFLTRHTTSFPFLKSYLENDVAKNYTISEKRQVFFKFVDIFPNPDYHQELKAKILQLILIPMFTTSFEDERGDELLGGPPDPEHDSESNIISVFINRVINPDKPFGGTQDSVTILLLQFSSLLVEHAAPHIHDSNNKKQGAKLRRLMTFAWPCLLPKQCVDPATKYHGHLLLAHIIAKFAIHKRIVLQVFHSLLKAHAIEARSIVRQALEILTPVVPIRMEDANATLVHWTKKIIVEEGHTVAQLVHMLQLLCRHYRVYYPVRQHLVQHMVSSMQRLGLTSSATIEQRRLAVDLAEVIIKWEFQRAREAQEMEGDTMDHDRIMQDTSAAALGMKRSVSDGTIAAAAATAVGGDSKRQRPQPQVADPTWPLDKQYADAVVNFLIRLACQVNDSQSTSIPGSPPSPGESLAKRCVTLVRTALKPDLWPYIEVKVAWFGKLFETLSQVDPATGNGVSVHASACTALEILTFLLISLPRPVILAGFKSLSRGLQLCMTCNNTKVLRYLHALLTRLMSMFPSEPASAMRSSKQEELEALYSSIPRIAAEGLTNYEKATNPSTTNLQCTIMILKAACNNDPTYIDRFLVLFVKVIQKLHKEHLTTSPETQTVSELLQLSLDMCKLRVSMMPQDCRKMFFSVISSLIEKSPDAKLLKTITKIVDDWIKNRHDYPSHSGPSLREKTVLLSRMMAFYEKRFPEDLELNTIFLDIVHFVYRDEQLSATELTAKLEPAFLSGLRCPHIQIRNKFFEVFDASIQPRLFDRLLYIMCSQNWEHCGGHYWIKQCIELLLMVGMIDGSVRASTSSPLLPSITSIGPANTPLAPDVTEPPAITSQPPEELMEGMEGDSGEGGGVRALEKVANKLNVFLNECRNIQTRQFVTALSQLCHDNTQLAHIVWVDMLPKLWSALSERQRHALSGEVSPFLCSAAHLMQMECHPSAIGTFLEAVLRCRPIPEIRSCLLKYLGKTHNYWHGVTLLLEERAASEGELSLMLKEPPVYDGDYTDEILDPLKHETLDSLSELYSMLNEDDMWAGLWTLRCRFPETVTAISFELQGVYEQAQESYEQVMKKARELHNVGPAPPSVIPEYKLWEEHWCKCARELGQWDTLTEFGKAHAGTNPFLVLENAWRVQDWTAMKEASTQAEPICTERYSAKLNLLRGFLALCYPDEQRLSAVEKLVEAASIQSVKHWRRLPSIVSHAHIPLLQLSQQIIELQEATQIQSGLQGGGLTRQGFQNEVKTIFKTWRNRLPNHFDDLSYWSDVFLWREHHFKCIVKAFDGSAHHGDQSNQSLLAVHNLASGITQFASIARKQKLVSVSLDSLSRIHSIPSVPVVDLFQKIRQQVKCYLMTSSVMEPTELQEALDFIESTNLKFFTKEMISEFMALKGAFLAQTGRSEEANKNFSAAVQLHDGLVKAWSLWGDFLEQLFTADRNITIGVAALTCFLHACRQQNEPKSRKYLAKTIWMLSYDDEKGTLAEALDKYYIGIPPLHWLPWIPQLLNCLIRNEGTHILNLLCSVGKAFPQAVYFPIRTLYLTLKMEQREKYKAEGLLTRSNSQPAPAKPSTTGNEGVEPMQVDSANQPAAAETASTEKTTSSSGTKSEGQSTQQSGKAAGTPQGDGPTESAPIRAPASLWRCSRIMHLLRDLHPTLLSALEGIVDQLIWFRESWYEDLLRQLNEGLALCYQVSFKNRTDVASTRITPELQQYVQKLVNSFGVSLEQSNSGGTLSQEALSKRAQIAAQDPTFQRLKAQFSGDFELSSPGPKRLNSLIAKLKRWIKILEMKTKSLYRSFLLEDRCRFLSNFSLSTADVEMPGEYLEPLPMPYYVKIARFMPRVEIVQKNSTNVRRLCIQGDNGKIYPYLVLNDATTASECRKEERVLQLFRLINYCLKKDKETCKRHLMFTLPKVVALSPQMRLAEDDVSAISLHDIFKQYTNEQGMEHDLIIIQFYERLGQLQSRGDKISLSTLKMMFTQLQQYFAPPTILRNWCERTCSSLTDFWTMRRQMMRQLALCGLAEYVFHLTRLDPEMLQVARNYGCLTQTFYRFEINSKGALDANRPVPFRLTPSLQTLFSPVGTRGPIQMSMIAITRCLVLPQFSLESLLFALLKDEFLLWCKQEQEESEGNMVSSAEVNNEAVIQRVTAAVEAITTRLYNLAEFETGQSQVSTIISAAASLDNICRMDPAWNPWL